MRREIVLMTASRRSRLRTPTRLQRAASRRRGNDPIAVSKVKLEIAVNDEFVKLSPFEAIMGAAHLQAILGTERSFVLPLDECYRIRTGEEGIPPPLDRKDVVCRDRA